MLNLGPFIRKDSLSMLQDILGTSPDLTGSTTLEKTLDILGDHPFYIRALIREIWSQGSTRRASRRWLDGALREALEATLFDQNGRLSLFMEQRYRVATGESSTLAAVLRGFVEPGRITDVAKMLHIRTGAVSTAVKTRMLEDALTKQEDDTYAFVDPTFALWLKHQVDFRQTMPPLLVGTDSEQAVAKRLAMDGFRGAYQSLASRGAFDLLAVHDTRIFGLQVKTTRVPYTLRAQEKTRLMQDARRLGIHPVLVLVVSGEARFYDLRGKPARGAYTARAETEWKDSLLALLR